MFDKMLCRAALMLAAPYLVQGLKTMESLAAVPAGWSVASTPSNTQQVKLQIGLTLQNLDQMLSQLYAVSTPGDPCYGQHYDRDELNAMVAPSSEASAAVLSWLASEGVTAVKDDGAWITFSTTVGNANKMLDANFLYYVNDGVQKLRTTQYSVPEGLAEYIDLLAPTTYFGRPTAFHPTTPTIKEKRQVPQPVVPAVPCATSISPACIRDLYEVNYVADEAASGSMIGFGSFLNQSAQYQDLQLYETYFDLPLRNFSVQLINGGTNDQDPATAMDGEANLDVQNIVGVTTGQLPIVEFITGGEPPFIPNLDEPTAADNSNEPYLQYYQYLLSKTNAELPQVISNSYGDDEQTVPYAYAQSVCSMIGMLGLRGITIFESSGDTGVGAPCQSNDGLMTPQFTPEFPATCPFVTSVGGTQAVNPEIAWTNGTGGFSNYFPQPRYQRRAVETYLHRYVSPATLAYFQPFFNQSGRGFPDVAAHSLRPDFQIYYDTVLSPSGGTSAAAPIWAAIVGLLNDARLRAGLPSLGFLNPWLYAHGYRALHDITLGGSVGCTGINAQNGEPLPGASVIPFASWNATVGWDPVTGYGTPDFQALLAQVLEMKPGKGQCPWRS